LAATTATVALTGDADGNAKESFVAAGTTDSTTTVSGTIGTHAAALVPGSYIWISDGANTGIRYIRILINQKSDGTIDGDSTVKTPILDVVVPTNINFALDPLQLSGQTTGNQIASANYKVINKSDVAIRVDFNLIATLASGVKFVEKSALSSAQNAPKNIYFAALGAKSVVPNSLTHATAATDTTAVFDYSSPTTLTPFGVTLASPGNETAKLAFRLGAATRSGGAGTPIDTLATDNAGVASFQFYAELNTYPSTTWKPNDIKVQGVFNFQGVKATDYKTPTAAPTDYLTDSLNQVPLYAGPGFIVGNATQNTISSTLALDALTDTVIPFYAGSASLASATLQVAPGYMATADDFELTNAGLVLKAATPSIFKTGTAGTYNMVLTVGGSTYTVTLVVTPS
jgi:hypothetical protein